MTYRLLAGLAAGCLWLLVAATAPAAANLSERLVSFQLKNGLTVLVLPRTGTPFFSAVIYVDAGSVDEPEGLSGLAHLLEHMAFKGTPFVGTSDWDKERPLIFQMEEVGLTLASLQRQRSPDAARIAELQQRLQTLQNQANEFIVSNEFDLLVAAEGGQDINATTSKDFTNYFMTLPKTRFEFWAMLESQRFAVPAWREFYPERDVVAEERRLSTDDSPIGKLYEEFIATAFKAHGYRDPVLGWMPDIYNLTITSIDRFYRTYYIPQNTVISIVGDVDVEEVKETMEKYFGTLPAAPDSPRLNTAEPAQSGPRTTRLKFDAQPQIIIGWHKPTFPDRDAYALEVLQYIISRSGRTSRLYDRLITKENVCQSVECFTAPGEKYPNLLCLWLTPRAPHTPEDAERLALEEIARLRSAPVTAAELETARNQLLASFLQESRSNLGLARQLGYYHLLLGQPDGYDAYQKAVLSVSADEVQAAAAKYLTPERMSVAILETATPAAAAAPAQ